MTKAFHTGANECGMGTIVSFENTVSLSHVILQSTVNGEQIEIAPIFALSQSKAIVVRLLPLGDLAAEAAKLEISFAAGRDEVFTASHVQSPLLAGSSVTIIQIVRREFVSVSRFAVVCDQILVRGISFLLLVEFVFGFSRNRSSRNFGCADSSLFIFGAEVPSETRFFRTYRAIPLGGHLATADVSLVWGLAFIGPLGGGGVWPALAFQP